MVRARPYVFGVAVVLGSCLAIGSAAADSKRDQADALLAEATKLGRAGNLRAAIDKFKQAEQLFPRTIHVCNIGLAYTRLNAWPQALRFLTQCKTRWSKKDARSLPSWVGTSIADALTKLRAGNFKSIRVTSVPTGATIWVEGRPKDETATTPQDVWLPFGSHTIHATSTGFTPSKRTLSVTADTSGSLEISLEQKKVAKPKPVVPKPKPPAAVKKLPEPLVENRPLPPEPPTETRRSTKSAVITMGVGAALLLNGVVFHTVALGTKGDAEKLRPGSQFTSERSTFRKQKYTALASYSLGALASGIGAYLWFRAKRSRTESRVRIGAGPVATGGVVWVQWDN